MPTWGVYSLLIGMGFCLGNLFQIWIRNNEINNIKNKESLLKTYEEYVGLLGEEILDLSEIAMKHGWQSKRLKRGSELRAKISNLKSKNNDI